MDQAASIALSGLKAASLRLQSASSSIVNSQNYQPESVAPSPSPGGGVRASLLAYDPAAPALDLPSALADFKLAEHDFRAGLLAYKTSAEMFKTLLDATA